MTSVGLVPMYVYFDNDGNLIKITNYIIEAESYIVVDYDLVSGLMNGTESLSNYKVEKKSNTEYQLIKNYENNRVFYDVDSRIYVIPKNNPSANLIIYQDIKNKKWVFKLDKNTKSVFMKNSPSIKIKLSFSITAKDDPNYLYRFIEFDFAEILKRRLEIPFRYIDEQSVNISIYTNKKLNSYTHEVINE